MFSKYNILFSVLISLSSAFSTTIHASETVKISSSYDKNGVTLLFLGVTYNEVKRFLLDKQDVTNELNELITEGIVTTEPESSNGFSLFFPLGEQDTNLDKKVLRKYANNRLTIVLQDGEKVSKLIVIDTVPIEKRVLVETNNQRSPRKQYDAVAGLTTGKCGSKNGSINYSSTSNPYPCCDNSGKGTGVQPSDGNCTWWGWDAVQKNWGINLNNWGGAPYWAGRARGEGYFVSTLPIVGTVASSSSGVGHIAYVTGYNGNNVTVSEMNCYINDSTRQGTSYTYSTTKFNGYITPLQLKDFWIKSTSITPSRNTVYSNFYLSQNFDAQFKIVNKNIKSPFYVQQFRVAVHKADSNLTWVRDFTTKGSILTGGYGNTFNGGYTLSLLPWINAGATFESGTVYTYFNSSEKGNYYIIPKMMIGNRWINLDKKLVTVY